MIILIHTSKTMRPPEPSFSELQKPELLHKAKVLHKATAKLSIKQIQQVMGISEKLAATTHQLIADWSKQPATQRIAVDSFLGDIYSGLQLQTWTEADKKYANEHLRILSGLYGILRPLDGIDPYRWEMGYKLPNQKFKNMYEFWGSAIADTLPSDVPILNLSAVEYSKTITPFVDNERIVTPKFLTVSSKTGEPTFVTVHAKIARGAFARWAIHDRVEVVDKLREFTDLNYRYNEKLSSKNQPVFVCEEFGGLGLSVRLS